MAGITDPRNESASLRSTIASPDGAPHVEDLGFCEKGSAKEHIADGAFELGGDLPVNTDGGLKTFGHPTGATGVRMVYENVLQLRGQAGDRQVAGVEGKFAVSHNIGGHPTACGIAVLGRE